MSRDEDRIRYEKALSKLHDHHLRLNLTYKEVKRFIADMNEYLNKYKDVY